MDEEDYLVRFSFPAPEPVRGKNRAPRHHMALHRLKKTWEEAVQWGWLAAGRPLPAGPPPHQVVVGLPMKNHKQADPHNYTSFEVAWIIDGLVLVGCWPSDLPAYVQVFEPELLPLGPVSVSIH